MPGMNGTGPMSQGPMTGRGMGLCNTSSSIARGSAQGYGRGIGLGQGCRRGFARGFRGGIGVNASDFAGRNNMTDINVIEQRQSLIEEQLESIKEKLASLSNDNHEKI